MSYGLGTHYLYRAYDDRGDLLYVGITSDLCARLRQHARVAGWWPGLAAMTIEAHDSWLAAARHERAVIALEGPTHNLDRSLRDGDLKTRRTIETVTTSDSPVTTQSAHGHCTQLPVFLGHSHSVTDSDNNPLVPRTMRAHATGDNTNNLRVGHYGHCPSCRGRAIRAGTR